MTLEELKALVDDLTLPVIPAKKGPPPPPPPDPAEPPVPIHLLTRRKLMLDQRNIQERARHRRPPVRSTTGS